MRREEEAQSISASFSDFCSVGQRIQGKEQMLLRENSRLRREHSQISQKYIKMCKDMAKMQMREIEKERKITELDLFYRKQIEELKKELNNKSNQLSKALKLKNRTKGHLDKENQSENSNKMEVSMENQSLAFQNLLNENARLRQMVETAVNLFQPYAQSKQNSAALKRISTLRKELQEKPIESLFGKANNILQDVRTKIDESQQELGQRLAVLKSKKSQLKRMPLTFDYDIEAESKELEVLLTDLDIQMRLTKPKYDDFRQ